MSKLTNISLRSHKSQTALTAPSTGAYPTADLNSVQTPTTSSENLKELKNKKKPFSLVEVEQEPLFCCPGVLQIEHLQRRI